ncbi:MAG: protein translocase subunit SecF [Candidatus Neomarinimicrobiota bacterium]|nr:protein translocase subunit SecF [Candidatus Neomarinimicrobiota bacterium]RKY49848.1 MAG: protein translocase subunit SecF [Candidatus Neomarinimicrobiota bacterium]
MFQIFVNTHYNIVGKRVYAYWISGLLILAGLLSFIFQGLNYGIDFRGGTLIQMKFEEPITAGEIRSLLKNPELGTPQIQRSGPNEYMIRVLSIGTGDEIQEIIQKDLQEKKFEVRRAEIVGPKIGEELRRKAIGAIFAALFLILVYISIRFEMKFAIGAVLALFHDVLITLGLFSLFQWEISMPVLAAFLTIVGYSLNDTIVVYDRIRENRLTHKNKAFPDVINLSINESLSRTVITSLTTFLVVLILVLFGGEVLFGFSIAMLIGIIVGTYSSSFVASPLLIIWDKKVRQKEMKKK